MNEAKEIEDRIIQLTKYLAKRGDPPDHFKYAISYSITLKDSRNEELSKLIYRHIDQRELKDKKVLEVGCGMGGFLAYLQENGIEAYGLDVDAELVRIAFTKENIIVGDIQKPPLTDKTFDAVIAIDVIEHIQNQKSAIQNMLATTKAGGKIILLTNNRLFPFDTDVKLFFINYLPKSLATKYLRFRRNNPTLEYENKNPTYFTFAKLCEGENNTKVNVYGIFTIFGYYVEKLKRFKKIASLIETISHRHKLFKWIQFFAPKLCLVIEKVE